MTATSKREAVRREPENAGFLDRLGLALRKLNPPREGLEYQLQTVAGSTRPAGWRTPGANPRPWNLIRWSGGDSEV
jgi:hypothetical protein